MIDHTYVLLIIDHLGDIQLDVYQHRINAVFDAVAAADRTLGDGYVSVKIPKQIQLDGLDLVFKAKHGPANVTLFRRVPK